MRDLPASFDPDVVSAIGARLAAVADEHGVTVPWAVESGSRAWGFPSPDSDYDCRFFFVRPAAAYLDPWRPRDVIETPADPVLDVNGWDLVKAVQLAARGNATVSEWLRSPLVYDGETAFRDDLLAIFDAVAGRERIGRHYLHVGRDHWERSGAGSGATVSLKRTFYALRPAAVLHWLSQHPARTSPPMNLQQLLDEAPPPARVRRAVDDLVAAKAVTRELGSGVLSVAVRTWVDDQFRAAEVFEAADDVAEDREHAADGFRRMLRRWAPRTDPNEEGTR